MDAKEEGSADGSNRYRKFGLPNWMMNNIERLNFVTDFEQYACSPPETDGFLTENMDNCDFPETLPQVILNDLHEDEPRIIAEAKSIPESNSAPSLLSKAAEHVASLSIVDSIKHEESYSSPDTTPCATPEPSPAPRRRMSGQQDTVRTNPGKWFYMGNFKTSDPEAKGQSLNSNKENRKKLSDKSIETSQKLRSPIKQKKDGIKLVISNFDINAISPSSW